MPGIYGVAAAARKGLKEITDTMLSEVLSRRDAGRFVHDAVQAADFSGFSLGNKNFSDLKAPHDDDDVTVLFDGNLFNLDELNLGDATYAEAIASLYKQKGELFAAELRGHFVIALLDKRQGVLRIYADPLVTKPIYFMHHDGALYFSTELKALLPVGPVPKHADPRALNNMVFSGFMITHRTFVKEVTELKQAGLLRYNIREDRLETGEYYAHSYQPVEMSKEKHVDRVAAAMLQAFNRALKHTTAHGRKLLLTATGGMDARAIISTAYRNYPGPIFGLTHRFQDDYELNYAEMICKIAGMHHIRLLLDAPGKLRSNVDAAVVAGEAMAHFNDVWRFAATVDEVNPEEFGIMHTGVPGSCIMGVFVDKESMKSPQWSINDPLDSHAVKSAMSEAGYFANPQANWLFHDAVGDGSNRFEMFHEDLREVVRDGWRLPKEWAFEKEYIILYTTQVKGTRGIFKGIEERMDFSAPFWDLDLLRACMEMPLAVKEDGAIYYDFLLRKRLLSDALLRVPDTWSLGPMRKRRFIQHLEQKWKRRFVRAVLGRISKKFRRIGNCPYQYAVESDDDLRNYMADMLLALPQPSAFGIDEAKWKKVLTQWRADPMPHIRLTRHFFWLLYFKRWHDIWGKYVSI